MVNQESLRKATSLSSSNEDNEGSKTSSTKWAAIEAKQQMKAEKQKKDN